MKVLPVEGLSLMGEQAPPPDDGDATPKMLNFPHPVPENKSRTPGPMGGASAPGVRLPAGPACAREERPRAAARPLPGQELGYK